MPTPRTSCRVIVVFEPRNVTMYLIDGTGTTVDEDAFGLTKTAPNIAPQAVARDVYNLLYQCAVDAIHRDEA